MRKSKSEDAGGHGPPQENFYVKTVREEFCLAWLCNNTTLHSFICFWSVISNLILLFNKCKFM
jgi:hypothetical protein